VYLTAVTVSKGHPVENLSVLLSIVACTNTLEALLIVCNYIASTAMSIPAAVK
jgi:hypothetical protein